MPHRQSQPEGHGEADQVGWAPDTEDVVDVLRGETWDFHGMLLGCEWILMNLMILYIYIYLFMVLHFDGTFQWEFVVF